NVLRHLPGDFLPAVAIDEFTVDTRSAREPRLRCDRGIKSRRAVIIGFERKIGLPQLRTHFCFCVGLPAEYGHCRSSSSSPTLRGSRWRPYHYRNYANLPRKLLA